MPASTVEAESKCGKKGTWYSWLDRMQPRGHCGSPDVQRDSGSLLAWQGPRGKRWNSLELPEDPTYPKRQLLEEPPMWVSGEYEGGKRIQNGTGMIHGGVRTSLYVWV